MQVISSKLGVLLQFEDATRRLTNGDCARRVNTDAQDEFSVIGKAFNELTHQLEESLQWSRALAAPGPLAIERTRQALFQLLVLSGEEMTATT